MKFEDYKNIIKETAVFPDTVDNFGIAYALIGVFDEFYEFKEASENNKEHSEYRENLIDEAGDVVWYLTLLADRCGVDFKSFEESIANIYLNDPTPQHTHYIFGNIKKYYRDGKQIDLELVSTFIDKIIYNMFNILKKEILCDVTIFNEILKRNYDKLIRRRKNNTLNGDGGSR